MTSVLPSSDVFFQFILLFTRECPVQKALSDMAYSLL